MISSNTTRVKIRTGNKDMDLEERVEQLERTVLQLSNAIGRDLSDIDLNNFSKYGTTQLDDRINKIISEKIAALGVST